MRLRHELRSARVRPLSSYWSADADPALAPVEAAGRDARSACCCSRFLPRSCMAALREASALWVTRVVRRRVGSESPSLRAICRGGDVELATCRKKATEKEIGSYSTYCDTESKCQCPGKWTFIFQWICIPILNANACPSTCQPPWRYPYSLASLGWGLNSARCTLRPQNVHTRIRKTHTYDSRYTWFIYFYGQCTHCNGRDRPSLSRFGVVGELSPSAETQHDSSALESNP